MFFFFQPRENVFSQLEQYDISVPLKDRFFPYFMTYDFESILQKQNSSPDTQKLRWEERHIPISVGVGSNVPGFEKAE